ncbi:hypothetical protein HYY75_07435 [bacterium]|nr:hypothetical protein [bacterium]
MKVISKFCSLALCVLFLLMAFNIFNLYFRHSNLDILDVVFSTPSRLVPGRSQEILVFVFENETSNSVSGLNLYAKLVFPSPFQEFVLKTQLREIKPGCYKASLDLPKTAPHGDYFFKVQSGEELFFSPQGINIRVGREIAMAVLPPLSNGTLGSKLSFKIGIIDPSLTTPISQVPIRCKVFSPNGLEIVNRMLISNPSGLAEFLFKPHSIALPGKYCFEFSAYDRCFSIEKSVFSPQDFERNAHDFLDHLFSFTSSFPFIPIPFIAGRPWYFTATENRGAFYHLIQVERRRIGKEDSVLVEFDTHETPGNALLEIWEQNALLDVIKMEKSSGAKEIFTPNFMHSKFPLSFFLWKKNSWGRPLDHAIFPNLPKSKDARGIFIEVSKYVKDGEAFLRSLLERQPPNLVTVKTSFSPNSAVASFSPFFGHLNWTILFLICLGGGFSAFKLFCIQVDLTHYDIILKNFRTIFFGIVSVGLGMTWLFNGWPSHSLIFFWVSLSFIASILCWITSGFGFTHPFQMQALFVSFVFCLFVFFYGFKISLFLRPVYLLLVIVSMILSAFLFILEFLHLEKLLGRIYSFFSYLGNRFFLPMKWGDWVGVGIQLGLVGILFYSFSFFPSFLNLQSHFFPESSLPPFYSAGGKWNDGIKKVSLVQWKGLNTFFPLIFTQGDSLKHTLNHHRSQFLTLKGRLKWKGSKIRKITVYLEFRDLLDRLIDCFKHSSPRLENCCLEAVFRIQRFPMLDQEAKNNELLELEGLLSAICPHAYEFSKKRGPIILSQKNLVYKTLEIASKFMLVDPVFSPDLQSLRPFSNWELGANLPWVSSLFRSPKSDDDAFPFSINSDFWKRNGTLEIIGTVRKLRRSFSLRGGTFSIVRGKAFPEELEITGFELVRNAPLILEIETIP